jgi:hypothetical protein
MGSDQPLPGAPPLDSTDGKVWAERYLQALRDHPALGVNPQFVAGWFTCALDTGRHYGAKAVAASRD